MTFHEVTPDLTRILLILEYHPKGLFERTGNLWRAQGRRARLELKHFGRHVMTQSILHPDELEGWRGEIRDGKVVEPEENEAQPDEDEQDEAPLDEGDEDETDDSAETDEDESEEPEETDEDEEPEEEAEDKPPARRGRPRKTAAKSAGSKQGARR